MPHGIVTKNLPTSVTTQDYTVAGMGTPKGYLTLGSRAVTPNNDITHWTQCVGASDFTTTGMHLVSMEHGQAVSDTGRRFSPNRVYHMPVPGGTDPVARADDNGAITDGVQIDLVTADAVTSRLCTAIMFAEGVANFDVQTPLLNALTDTTITTGFMPDVIIGVSACVNDKFGANGASMVKFFYDRVKDNYITVGMGAANGDATPSSSEGLSTTFVAAACGLGGTLYEDWTLGNFTATGFDAIEGSGGGTRYITWISIKMDTGYTAEVGTFSAPVSTGVTAAVSGLGYPPSMAMFIGNDQVAPADNNTTGTLWMGACTSADQVCVGGRYEDFDTPVPTAVSSFHRTDTCIYHLNENGFVNCAASLDSFSGGAINLNFTTANRALLVGYLVFSGTLGTNTDIEVPMGPLR